MNSTIDTLYQVETFELDTDFDKMNFENIYLIKSKDLNRPWGGFYCIDPKDLNKFIEDHFKKITLRYFEKNLSPKILLINPGKRLSWQYHDRRKEIWSIMLGPVGIIKSYDDNESKMFIANTGDIITIDVGERHRIVGLSTLAIVAELWQHIDDLNPSNEQDIVRLQDDFNR
jgi:mannose-6-phosphate isomerase